MSMLKKIAVCVSAGALLTSFSATFASAANDDYAKFNSSSYAAYTDSLTKADKIAIAAKEARCAKLGAQKAIYGNAAAMNSLSGLVVYEPTAGDAVATCIYTALMYIVKKSPSQATIAKTVKNDFAKIPAYMNARQSKCHYILTQPQSITSLQNCINYDINTAKVPAFVRLTNVGGANWYYAAASTCMLIVGISADKSVVRIADPLSKRVTGCPGIYTKSTKLLYQYTRQICW